MSKDTKEQKKTENPMPNDVISLASVHCCVENCKKKNERAGFCAEHYIWFKEGLVNKKGQKPTDFDKKYQAFITRVPKAA